MKFMAHTVLSNDTDPDSDLNRDPTDRLQEVIDRAVLLERLGFDGFGVGERHVWPDIASSPAVVLAYIAAATRRIRLVTAVTVLNLHDPVRVAEDFATLDNLSRGRVDLIIGKGTRKPQADLFGLDLDQKWNQLRAHYCLLRRLLTEENVTWNGDFRPPLTGVTTQPRPYQRSIRIWHGSASSQLSTELAAEFGDPLFSANAMKPVGVYHDLVEHYRQRFVFHGHDPARIRVGLGVASVVVARNSQDALRIYRELWERLMVRWRDDGFEFPFDGFEDWVGRSSVLIGSPAQVEDKLAALHARFGHDLVTVGPIGEGLRPADQDSTIELFATEVMPRIKARIPSNDWGPNGIATQPELAAV